MTFALAAIGRASDVPIFQTPHVPLTRTEDDGTVRDALCWFVDGRILVHPDRWNAFQALVNTRCR